MKRILITGANKGIGLATAQAILEHDKDTCVLLGARDSARGQAAIQSLCDQQPSWASRLDLLEIDVASEKSVVRAHSRLENLYPNEARPLYAIVNNAGIGLGSDELATVLEVNTLGVKRVCDAFIPTLGESGRIVNIASASGPKFVSQCSPERQAFFQDANLDWAQLEQLMAATLACQGNVTCVKDLGLGEQNAYGFSKACLSLYTLILARENPQLAVNACTPGYIETDLTRPQAEAGGVAPAALGMKPPVAGTAAPLFLLFGTLSGSGHFYGSDAKRSPLDRYRAPDTPAYTGD